jgi:putative nucleotidyltransferase with HDIG domain
MTATLQFLTALGQALAALSLYGADHPTRQAAVARLLTTVHAAVADGTPLRLSFIDDDVVAGARPLTELRGWDWGAKLSAAGVQRLEIAPSPAPTAEDVDAMLTEMRVRIALPTEPARPFAAGSIRLGALALVDARADTTIVVNSVVDALQFSGLGAELEAIGFVHDEVSAGRDVPMAEVEAVVHGLALTIRREQDVVLPLLDLRTFDEYTTTHSCNVSMLSIGLSEALGLSDGDARAIGMAALLHDIGKVRLPQDLLTKPGQLSDSERLLIETHPLQGAKILSARGLGNGLAATVAYEHHIWYNGIGGYPGFAFPRTTHYASRIVHVCDIYDALCSRRPYRDAWPREKALNLLQTIAGTELDPAITAAFVRMASAATEHRHTRADEAA